MDARTAQYLRDFIKHDSEFLDGLEKSNRSRNDIQPMIELEVGKFLVFLITKFEISQEFGQVHRLCAVLPEKQRSCV